MPTQGDPVESAPGREAEGAVNGAVMASILAAGIGAFATGLFVLMNEAGIFAAPALYGPAGGVSGRATLAVVTWLIAWAILHRRWRDRSVGRGRVFALAVILICVGLLATFPPVWSIF